MARAGGSRSSSDSSRPSRRRSPASWTGCRSDRALRSGASATSAHARDAHGHRLLRARRALRDGGYADGKVTTGRSSSRSSASPRSRSRGAGRLDRLRPRACACSPRGDEPALRAVRPLTPEHEEARAGGTTGVLLVGGASRRFGAAKALAPFDGESLAARAWPHSGWRATSASRSGSSPTDWRCRSSSTTTARPCELLWPGWWRALRLAAHDVAVVVTGRHAATHAGCDPRTRGVLPRRGRPRHRPAAGRVPRQPHCRSLSAGSRRASSR